MDLNKIHKRLYTSPHNGEMGIFVMQAAKCLGGGSFGVSLGQARGRGNSLNRDSQRRVSGLAIDVRDSEQGFWAHLLSFCQREHGGGQMPSGEAP